MKATLLYTTADKILMYDKNHLLGELKLSPGVCIFLNILTPLSLLEKNLSLSFFGAKVSKRYCLIDWLIA